MRKWIAALLVLAGAGEVSGAVYQVIEGDCLWALAERHYKNPYQWRRIAEANSQIVKDPHWIYPGQIITIPDLAVEASYAVTAPGPTEASAPVAVRVPEEPAPAPAEEAPAAPEARAEPKPALGENISDKDDKVGLTDEMPPSMSGYSVGRPRLKMDSKFRPDGAIIEGTGDDDMEHAAKVGDKIVVALEDGVGVKAGERFTVYRQLGVLDDDADKKAIYMHAVAQVEALAEARGRKRMFLILHQEDTVQTGDWVKRGGELK